MEIYDFKKLLGPCKKTTKRIIFVVLFQGHVYQCEHFELIRGAFRWFFAKQWRNLNFYENLSLNSSIFFYTGLCIDQVFRKFDWYKSLTSHHYLQPQKKSVV